MARYILPAMVEKETITPDLEEVRRCITAARLERRESGSWVLIVTLAGLVTIDTNRSAAFVGEPRISGKQQGRRPAPPRKMSKKGKFAKRK